MLVAMATSMVKMSGMAKSLVATPTSNARPPNNSALAARKTINVGMGRPRPQSGFPNQATISSKLENLFTATARKIGAR